MNKFTANNKKKINKVSHYCRKIVMFVFAQQKVQGFFLNIKILAIVQLDKQKKVQYDQTLIYYQEYYSNEFGGKSSTRAKKKGNNII